MFVQFVFEMYTYNSHAFLWPFCKALDFSKRSNTAIIVGEKFRKTSLSTFQEEGRQEVLDQLLVDTLFLYKIPKDEDFKSNKVYFIPDNLLNEIIQEKGSVSGAYNYLLSHEDSRLTVFFHDLVHQIEFDCKEEIEAFIAFQSEIKSLAATARDRNIPVIHWELGSWRYPTYLNTAYWDLEDLYSGRSVEHRWKCFCKEHEEKEIPVLSKRECLALLLERDYLYLIDEYDRKPSKKIGIALEYTTSPITSSKTYMDNSELLYRVRDKYGLGNMLVRKHPGDPYGSQYPNYAVAMEQQPGITPEFVLNCETIVSLMSGIGMEAMLFNRKAITLLPCPSYFASGHDLEGEGLCCDENFISFFAFCYLIPLEYIMDVDYLRWRLTMPTEREIYMKHLEFYFRKKALPLSLIHKPTGERLDAVLKEQRYYQPKKVTDLENKVAELKQELEILRWEAEASKQENVALRKSKSYRIGRMVTWPYRKIRDKI